MGQHLKTLALLNCLCRAAAASVLMLTLGDFNFGHAARYDETRPPPLDKSNSNLPISSSAANAVAIWYREYRTAKRNISLGVGT